VVSFLDAAFKFTRLQGAANSFIDHFAVSKAFATSSVCVDFQLLDDKVSEVNLSDHLVVSVRLTLPVHDLPVQNSTAMGPTKMSETHVLWSKAMPADITAFQESVSCSLRSTMLRLPIGFTECKGCSSLHHREVIDSLSHTLHSALLNSSMSCIPRARSDVRVALVNWDAECADYRKKSIFWHNMWVSCGRPATGMVADIMRSTRKQYHVAVNRLKLSQSELINSKIAASCMNGTSSEFWRQVKQANAHKSNAHCSNVVNGHNGSQEIANEFRSVYADIFRAGFTSTDDLSNMRSTLDTNCRGACWKEFSADEVLAACSKLKPNKKDADTVLNSSAILHAPMHFYYILCCLINAVVSHGHVPSTWLRGTIIPLIKSGHVDKTVVSSYRPITLSSLFGKVIDILILDRYCEVFMPSERQFGFRKNHSTNHCTFVVKEVVSYYLNNNSDVYACALDMQKAFDRVDLIKLFTKLISSVLPAHVIRILFILYSSLCLSVFWNGALSTAFISLNGVKQGGILSPFLFCIFINDLIVGLEGIKVGCYIGQRYFGCVAYADDILLMAPSLAALRIMLKYCTNFADINNILFNPTKSHCIKFSLCTTAISQFVVLLQGIQLSWTNSIVHLGHILQANNKDTADINARLNDFTSQSNYFFARFGHLPVVIKSRLFGNFCQSFYGCVLWDFRHNDLTNFDTVWRKAIRRLWGLPYRTHCNLLPYLMNGQNFRSVIESRFCKFVNACLCSVNNCVNFLARVSCSSPLYHFGNNLSNMYVNQNPYDDVSDPIGLLLCELLFIRNNSFFNNLSSEENELILFDICCN